MREPSHHERASYVGDGYAGRVADDSWQTRFSTAVRAAAATDLGRDPSGARRALEALYVLVREGVEALKMDGVRPERALMVLKRAACHALDVVLDAADGPVPGRVADREHAQAVVQHVVRWSVEAYFRASLLGARSHEPTTELR
jgi:hypothetical protein